MGAGVTGVCSSGKACGAIHASQHLQVPAGIVFVCVLGGGEGAEAEGRGGEDQMGTT